MDPESEPCATLKSGEGDYDLPGDKMIGSYPSHEAAEAGGVHGYGKCGGLGVGPRGWKAGVTDFSLQSGNHKAGESVEMVRPDLRFLPAHAFIGRDWLGRLFQKGKGGTFYVWAKLQARLAW